MAPTTTSSSASSSLVPGALIGAYEVVDLVGHGGFGDVALARAVRIEGKNLCVIKTSRASGGLDDPSRRRFVEEARTLALLDHPNISRLLDVGVDDGQLFLALEYVPGIDLARLMKLRRRGLPPALALAIIAGVLRALDHAHSLKDPRTQTPLGLIHRDVSLKNILVTVDGDVKLIDFGIATSSTHPELTQRQNIIGTLGYMAPERLDDVELDARVDVYSLGVVLYEILSGRRYFAGKSASDVMTLQASGLYTPPMVGWSPAMQHLVSKATAADRNERFASAAEMLRALVDVDPALGDGVSRDALAALLSDLLPSEIEEMRARARIAARKTFTESTVVQGAPMTLSSRGNELASFTGGQVVDDDNDLQDAVIPDELWSGTLAAPDATVPSPPAPRPPAALPKMQVLTSSAPPVDATVPLPAALARSGSSPAPQRPAMVPSLAMKPAPSPATNPTSSMTRAQSTVVAPPPPSAASGFRVGAAIGAVLTVFVVVPLTLFLEHCPPSRPAPVVDAGVAEPVDAPVAEDPVAEDPVVRVERPIPPPDIAPVIDTAPTPMSGRPFPEGGVFAQMAWLRQNCGGVACAKDIRELVGSPEIPVDEVRRRLRDCAVVCSKPSPEFDASLKQAQEMILTGKFNEAVPLLKDLEHKNPDDPRVHRNLGIGYAKLRDNASAMKHYKRYLELAPNAPDSEKVRAILKK